MFACRLSLCLLGALLAASFVERASASPANIRVRRQLADDNTLQPIDEEGDQLEREKRKLEDVTQAKYGVKNALLGFVFGTGTTSHLAESTSSITSAAGHRSQRGSGITNDLRLRRQSQKAGDIPVFDRNKVSLDLPGSLFGPSVSLLINTTKIVGSVIQNSAVRYQTFLRLFRPLFRGPFEIKGLDPPTTTTTTTTTKLPPIRDNEVRRR